MGACQSGMAFLTGLGFSCFFGFEGMGSVTAITFVLDIVAPFTKGFSQWKRERFVLGMFLHSGPRNGMPALEELGIFFFVTFPADIGFDGRFCELRLVMVLMEGNTVHSLLSMLAIDPSQEDAASLFLMTGDAIADLFFCPKKGHKENNGKD
jgi:hypothetical protein